MASITTADVTTGAVGGDGIFDQLMLAVSAHVQAEFNAGRIRGAEYSTVYLGALQTAMQTGVQYALAQERTEKEIELLEQQLANAIIEGRVQEAQECLLKAQYDNMLETVKKTAAETALLAQRKLTEQAQINAIGVDDDSVIGRQKELYKNQADGYLRDAEQKVAKIYADMASVQMSVSDYAASDANKLSDTYVGAAMTKLLSGIEATV